MLSTLIHSIYCDCYRNGNSWIVDKIEDIFMKDDMYPIRFYHFNTYLYKDTKSEITEFDHGPCWNPVEYWEDVHGYESSRDINCGIYRNFSQLGWGIRMFIIERIIFLILALTVYYNTCDECSDFIESLGIIYGVILLLRLRQFIIYLIFRKRLNKSKSESKETETEINDKTVTIEITVAK